MNTLGKAVIAAGAATLAGFAGYFFYEKATEQPPYTVLFSDGRFELREYPELLVAQVVHRANRRKALTEGFTDLAGYIFAKSRGGEKIPMTAPVMQDREKIAMTAPVVQENAGEDEWRTRFVMPSKYNRETLPTPPAGVSISEIPSRRMAAVRFSGTGEDRELAEREAELRRWIKVRGLKADGPAEYAFYNSPFIPGPLRRNEVLIAVAD